MKKNSQTSEARRAKYARYLKQHYLSLKEQKNRGGFVPEMDHFIAELKELVRSHSEGEGKLVANG